MRVAGGFSALILILAQLAVIPSSLFSVGAAPAFSFFLG